MQRLAETEIAIQAARAGAEVLLRHFRGNYEIECKESFNLVSKADTESQDAIARVITQAWPADSLLGEEDLSKRAPGGPERLWIVDPLDGTNNFVHGLDHFAVSIAFVEGGTTRSAVVYKPVSDEWFIAEAGHGAWYNGTRAHVSAATKLDEALLAVGFYYDRDLMMKATLDAMEALFRSQIHGFRRFGAASLDLCLTGCGQLDGYFEFHLAPWDHAAGALFVLEAGGRVSDGDGNSLAPWNPASILAATPGIHESLLEHVRPFWHRCRKAPS